MMILFTILVSLTILNYINPIVDAVVSIASVFIDTFLWHDREVRKLRLLEHRYLENRLVESLLKSLLEIRLSESRLSESRLSESRLLEIRILEDRILENSIVENSILHERLSQIRLSESHLLESRISWSRLSWSRLLESLLESLAAEPKTEETKRDFYLKLSEDVIQAETEKELPIGTPLTIKNSLLGLAMFLVTGYIVSFFFGR
jgi:hypothetical protein